MAQAKKTESPTLYAVTLETYQNAQRFAQYLIATDSMTDDKIITALQSAVIDETETAGRGILVHLPAVHYRTVKSASWGFKYKLADKDATALEIANQPAETPKAPKKKPAPKTQAPKPAETPKPAQAPKPKTAPKTAPKQPKAPADILNGLSPAEISALFLKAAEIIQAQAPKPAQASKPKAKQ